MVPTSMKAAQSSSPRWSVGSAEVERVLARLWDMGAGWTLAMGLLRGQARKVVPHWPTHWKRRKEQCTNGAKERAQQSAQTVYTSPTRD